VSVEYLTRLAQGQALASIRLGVDAGDFIYRFS
jgi:hypothetical protein